MSIPNITITELAAFTDHSENGGVISNGAFSGSSSNSGGVATASFADTTTNTGAVSSAAFSGSASNTGLVAVAATFSDTTSNAGTVVSGSFTGTAQNTGAVAVASFADTTTNTGTVSAAEFKGSAQNSGTVALSASFAGSAANTGSGVVAQAVFTGTASNAGAVAVAAFTGSASNAGSVATATFSGTTTNTGVVSAAEFKGSAQNSGVIALSAAFSDTAANTGAGSVAQAVFTGTASNAGSVATATFAGTATNSGTVSAASFAGSAINAGVIVQQAVFSGSASNSNSGSVQGTVVFSGSAVNTGTVASAVFLGTAVNTGTVTLSAAFADSASNSGSIQGNATFADTTTNTGAVSGDVQVAPSASNSGTVGGSTTTYTQPDGYFANGYYSGGIKAAPPNYTTLVHQVNSFWYKYNASGVGSLADGKYDDGSGTLYNFTSGIKGAVDGQWYSDSSDAHHTVTLNGTVTQSDEGGGVVAASFDGNNNYLTITPTASEFNLSSGNSTIEFWFKPTQAAYQYVLLGPSGIAIHTYGEGKLWINNGIEAVTKIDIAFNTWQHVAIVTNNGTRYTYLNGTLVDTTIQTFASSSILYVGGKDGNNGSLGYNGKVTNLRITNTAVYNSNFTVPTTVPTAVAGTQLLLNFGATAVPTVTMLDSVFTDASIDGSFNITPYSYTTHNGRFYMNGVPFTGTHSVTVYTVNHDGYGTPTDYSTSTVDIYFIVGTEAANTGATASYSNGVWTITGNVDVDNRNLTSLNFADCVVSGAFNCYNNQLTSLQYAPSTVGGDFYCYGNQLTSLQGAPSTVGGDFYCGGNQLTSLQYAPSTVGGDFYCYNNQLTSLQYAPSIVGGDFYCGGNQLTSLQGAPSTVGGAFTCNYNQLTSLQYAPSIVGGDFYCNNNQLTSLQYAPSIVGGDFYCGGNQLTSLQYAPSIVGGDFYCGGNQLTSLQGAPSTVGGAFTCNYNQLTSLQGAPSSVGGGFYCDNNHLTSLQGAPSTVSGNFYCYYNQLSSLQYAPSTVGGSFNCYYNQFSFPIISPDVANVYWEYASNNARKHATYHHYIFGNYYMDVATAVVGTVLYTASDSNTVVANASFNTTTNTVYTNGNGEITSIAELWYKDSSNAHRAVTLHGNVTSTNLGGGVRVANFTGDNTSYLDVNISGVGTGDFTFETFLKSNLTNPSTTPCIVDSRNSGTSFNPVQGNSGQIRASDDTIDQDLGVLAYGAWHHLAIVRTGGHRYYYVDGVLKLTSTDNNRNISDGQWLIGACIVHSGYDWNGQLASMRLSKTARYSGSSLTVPTAIHTPDSNDVFVLNFGASAVPTV